MKFNYAQKKLLHAVDGFIVSTDESVDTMDLTLLRRVRRRRRSV